MIFAQHLRLEAEPKDQNGVPKTAAHNLLTNYSSKLTKDIKECKLNEPTREEVAEVFERWGAHDQEKIAEFLKTLDMS